jgi:hypothetical protein
MATPKPSGKPKRRLPLILLIVPFVGTLWVPFYNSTNPTFNGIPFFYWYLFLWVIISAVLTALVYFTGAAA